MVVGVGAPRGVVLGPVGGCMQGSECWDVLVVAYPCADWDWGVGERVGGKQGGGGSTGAPRA